MLTKATSKPSAEKKKATRAKGGGDKAPTALAAAVRVLEEVKQPMCCKEVVEVMLDRGWWSTSGNTPAATL